MFNPLNKSLTIPSFCFYGSVILGRGKRRSLRMTIFFLLLIIISMTSVSAFAQSSGFAVLDPVLNKYHSFQLIWYAKIKVVAERLFWILVSVDFAWSGVIYVLDKNTIEEIVISNVKKILTIGFFYSLLKFSDTWIPAIINSFAKIGLDAAGVLDPTPDGIARTGYELALACFGAIKKLGMLDAIAVVLPVTFIAIVTLLAFLFVAAQLLITLVESYLAIGSGVILLGFGGSRWTTDFATKYLQYAVGTGVKLMILYLIVGVGQDITKNMSIDSNQLIQSCLQALAVAIIYGYLAIQIPAMASAMMSGSPSMTAGALASTALTFGAAAAGAGAATAGAGKAAMGGAANAVAGAAGLGQALSAGLNSAADHGLSGVGAAMHAAGEVASHGMSMAVGGIGDAVAGGGKAFGDRVADSTGGRIASQIEASRGGAMQGVSGGGSADAGAASGAQAGGSQTGGVSAGAAPAGGAQSAPSASGAAGADAGAAPALGAQAGGSQTGGVSAGAAPAGGAQSAPSASGAAGADAGAAPASRAQAGGSQTGGVSAGAAPAGGGGSASASVQERSSNLGDASGAEVGPAQGQGNGVGDGRGSNDSDERGKKEKDPLHSQIRDLQGFVPSDAAQAAGIQIDLKHTQD